MPLRRIAARVDSDPVVVRLTQNRVALIDASDSDLVASRKWQLVPSRNGKVFYAKCSHQAPDGKWTTTQMHRLIMGAGKGQIIDHINGDGLDNRRRNLRFATNSQNVANSSAPSNNTSGFKGVTFDRRKRKWTSRVQSEGRRLWLGYFDSPREAYAAYVAFATKIYGDFARVA